MDYEEELSPSVTLDLRGIQVRLEEQDGDLIMLVDDGDVQIEFSSGLNGTWDQAITGAEKVAATAAAFAGELRRRRPEATRCVSRVQAPTGSGWAAPSNVA